MTEDGEPQYYDEAIQMVNLAQCELAMKEDMSSHEKNETWSLTELPVGKKVLQNKNVYKNNEEHDGIKRYKASHQGVSTKKRH